MVNRVHTVGSPSGSYYEYLSKQGGDTPKSLRKPGLWRDNSYVRESELMFRTYTQLTNNSGGVLPGGPYSTDSFSSFGYQTYSLPPFGDVLSKVASKWRDSRIDLGMYLSPEGRESVESVYEMMKKISNSARDFKRGNLGAALRHLNRLPRSARREVSRKFEQGDISGAFLSAHLGWEPLIKDAYAACNFTPRISSKRITARKLGSYSTIKPSKAYGTFREEVKVQTRLILDVGTRPPTNAQKLGLDNPFRVAWELVLLSFVADYFLPIGALINAYGDASALYGLKGWTKDVAFYRASWEIPAKTQINSTQRTKTEISTVRSKRYFKRSPYKVNFSSVARGYSIKLPTSVWKLSTMAALTHQRILSLGR